MPLQDKISIGIIGAGHLGSALAAKCKDIFDIRFVLARSDDSASRAEAAIDGKGNVVRVIEDMGHLPDLLLICVNDRAISTVTDAIASHFGASMKGKYIVHCSGAFGPELLQSCENLGAITASLHPYQTFWHADASVFDAICWLVDCRESQSDFFRGFIEMTGGRPFLISDQSRGDKALYHASAVAASNCLTTAIRLGRLIAKNFGIDPAAFLPPIVRRTVENNLMMMDSGESPLTGPIARADIDALQAHLAALKDDENLQAAYAHLCLSAAVTALSDGTIDKDAYGRIAMVLGPHAK